MKKINIIKIDSIQKKFISIDIECSSLSEIMKQFRSHIGQKCTTISLASEIEKSSIYSDDFGWFNLDPNNNGVNGFIFDNRVVVPGNAICVGPETDEYIFGSSFPYKIDEKFKSLIKFGNYKLSDYTN